MQPVKNHDARLDGDAVRNPKALVGWVVVASYAYYHLDESVLSDTKFDQACKWLLDNYASVRHRLKYLLPRECLVAGSPHHLGERDYPEGVKRVARKLIAQLEK